MKTQTVKIDKDIYVLTAVTCDVSGAISIELLSNMAPLIIAFMEGDIELVNRELRTSVNSDKLMRMIIELINPMILEVNGELIRDWKEHFACKPLTLFRLGWEALRFNCEDFFTFISGFAKENNLGQSWNEVIKSLKSEGVEIPPLFSLLLQNGEVETEEKTEG
jgi:hypothetical protein